jgi:ABC-type glycerol-3-phosphate transport system substrate-binding protein
MPQDFQAGIAADVFSGCCSFFPVWGQQGDCLDLRPYVKADLDKPTLDDWDPVQYQALFTRDGRQYGLPKYHGALVLYYNRDMFDAKGVDYPNAGWDHERYLAAMQLLGDDRNGDGKRDAWGSMVDISWALKDILADAAFRVGVAIFPAGPQRRATLATTDAFGIYARTRHPEAAWEMMQFLISKEYGRAMAKAAFLQPARWSLVEDWVSYIRAEYPEKTVGMDIAAFADGQRKGYSVIAETFADQAVATRLGNAAWQEIFTLGKAPVSHLVEVSRQIEAAQKGK